MVRDRLNALVETIEKAQGYDSQYARDGRMVLEWVDTLLKKIRASRPTEACPGCGAEPGCDIDCETCSFIWKWQKAINALTGEGVGK